MSDTSQAFEALQQEVAALRAQLRSAMSQRDSLLAENEIARKAMAGNTVDYVPGANNKPMPSDRVKLIVAGLEAERSEGKLDRPAPKKDPEMMRQAGVPEPMIRAIMSGWDPNSGLPPPMPVVVNISPEAIRSAMGMAPVQPVALNEEVLRAAGLPEAEIQALIAKYSGAFAPPSTTADPPLDIINQPDERDPETGLPLVKPEGSKIVDSRGSPLDKAVAEVAKTL